jgi:hypothetical protein
VKGSELDGFLKEMSPLYHHHNQILSKRSAMDNFLLSLVMEMIISIFKNSSQSVPGMNI